MEVLNHWDLIRIAILEAKLGKDFLGISALNDDSTNMGEMVFSAQVVGRIAQVSHFIYSIQVVTNAIKLLIVITKHVNIINI